MAAWPINHLTVQFKNILKCSFCSQNFPWSHLFNIIVTKATMIYQFELINRIDEHLYYKCSSRDVNPWWLGSISLS